MLGKHMEGAFAQDLKSQGHPMLQEVAVNLFKSSSKYQSCIESLGLRIDCVALPVARVGQLQQA